MALASVEPAEGALFLPLRRFLAVLEEGGATALFAAEVSAAGLVGAESGGIAGAGIFAATGALVGPAVAVTLAESLLSLATSAIVLSALVAIVRPPRGG